MYLLAICMCLEKCLLHSAHFLKNFYVVEMYSFLLQLSDL